MTSQDDQPSPDGADATNPKPASSRYGVAEAERLWRTHYGAAARADRIASELDALFRITERPGGAQYLLRIVDNRDGIADLQIAILDHIAAAVPTLPVPRVRRTRANEAIVAASRRQDTADAAFATSFLPGEPLTRRRHLPRETPLFRMLARVDQSLHGFAHPRARRALLWDVSHAERIVSLTRSIPDPEPRELAESALERWSEHAAPRLAGLRRQTIHNDFNPSNLLVDESGAITGILDFGDAIEAPLVCDLATAIAYQDPSCGFEALLRQAARDYASDCPLTAEEAEILPVLVGARAAMVVTIAHWRAAQQPRNRAYLLRNVPAAHRLLRSAARHT